MNELTYIEAFIPLGGGQYVTLRGAVRMPFDAIEQGCDERLAVRFSELDERRNHVPGAGHAFVRGYDRAHDYRPTVNYFREDISSLDRISSTEITWGNQ